MISIKKQSAGFTMIEILLYVGIASFMLLTINIFVASVLQSRIKNQTVLEVENTGLAIMQNITQVLRHASQINLVSPQSLNATMPDGQQIIFSLTDGIINLTQNNVSYPLVSSNVNATSLVFLNLAQTEKPASVHIEFELEHLSPEGRNETSYNQKFYGTATLRK